jgi:hypothetical protein
MRSGKSGREGMSFDVPGPVNIESGYGGLIG